MSLATVFLAGLATFLSPCLLPLIPVYLAYLGGSGVAAAKDATHPGRVVVTNTLLFIAGFTLVFVLLGLSASFVGRLLTGNQVFLREGAGVLLFMLGLNMTGVCPVKLLDRQVKAGFVPRVPGLAGSLLFGMAFAAGWTPCTGPVLAGVLVLAGNSAHAANGAALLALYSLGLGVPFLLVAVGFDRLGPLLRRLTLSVVVQKVCGIILMLAGLLMFTNHLACLAGYV